MCGGSSWIIPLGLALPYIWRLAQCIRVYRDTGAKPQARPAILTHKLYRTRAACKVLWVWLATCKAWCGVTDRDKYIPI